MDKFFYRLTTQTVIKGILTAGISLFSTGLLYVLFISILQPVSAQFDYWFQTIAAFAVAVVADFMIITVKDDYSTADTYSIAVGRFWSERVYKRKKVSWFSVELMMLPLPILAIASAYLFYHDHAAILAEYAVVYSAAEVSASAAQDLFFDNILHFLKPALAVFFFAQWRHVRGFAVAGRCPKCKAAFSLGFHQVGEERTDYSSKITKKGRTAVVGAAYNVTLEDGKEVDRTKIADTYGTVYDRYQTNTKTTYRSNVCHCAFCGEISTKTDVSVVSSTKKLP